VNSHIAHSGQLGYSFRRQMLDADLARATPLMSGVVLDVGGKRVARRGKFRPPTREDIHAWWALNITPTASPHILGSAEALPLRDGCIDTVICTEAIEHFLYPDVALYEVARVLKPGGRLILSMPFLFRVHGDPYDYQRFTGYKLAQLLTQTGFEVEEILKQGLFFTTVCDLIKLPLAELRPALVRWPLGAVFLLVAALLRRLERLPQVVNSPLLSSYTTGHFVIARRNALARTREDSDEHWIGE